MAKNTSFLHLIGGQARRQFNTLRKGKLHGQTMADVDIRTLESEQDAGWKQTAKDLGSGAAGGIAQVLLGKFY